MAQIPTSNISLSAIQAENGYGSSSNISLAGQSQNATNSGHTSTISGYTSPGGGLTGSPYGMGEFGGYIANVNMNVSVITNVRQSGSGLGAYVQDQNTESDGDAFANAIIDFGYHFYSPFFTYARGAIKAAKGYSNRQWWNQFGSSNTLGYGTSSANWTSTGSAETDPAGNNLSTSNVPDYFKVKWSVNTTGSTGSSGGAAQINTATDYSGGRSTSLGTAAMYSNGLTNDTWIAHPTTAGSSTSHPQYGISFRSSASVLNFSTSAVTSIARGVWTVEVWWRKTGYFDTKIMEHTFETKATATAYTSGGFPP